MTPEQAYDNCNGKINKNLEPFIIKNPYYAYLYARDIIKGRWLKAESIFIKDSHYAYFYALELIKGRWIEAEDIISTNSQYAYLYAIDVIQGKLPENMHNAMILHADNHAKEYLNFIKNNPQP